MPRFLLLCLISFSFILLQAQPRLNVEGDARITGKLELSQSATDSSVVIGLNAGNIDNTYNNLHLGANAGSHSLFGRQNTFVGHRAGDSTLNHQNTFIGYRAGSGSQYGWENTFIGFMTGIITDGQKNVFVGGQAGMGNTLGDSNVFLGTQAGVTNITGSYNTFLGTNSGFLNESGSGNFFAGCYSGTYNVTGYDNTFLGFSTGSQNISGHSNTYLGKYAGQSISVDSLNTFVGIRAGRVLFSGSRNTFFGADSGPLGIIELHRSIAIGLNAKVACSNCAVIGGTGTDAVQVGIGTSNPRGALHILTTGAPPTGLSTEENGLLFGVESTAGYKWIQSYGGALALNSEGNNVGISTALPNYRLEVNGSAGKPGGGDWTNSASDRRLKKNIRPYEDGLEQLLRIQPVWYQYNGKTNLPTDQEYVGIIAQEMQQIAPYTVGSFQYEGSQYLNFDGSALRYMLINAVQEQQLLLEKQALAFQKQQREIDRLTKLLDQLLAEKETLPNEGSTYVLDLGQSADLSQNAPNPFRENTVIHFHIPEQVKKASLQITTPDGKLLKEMKINTSGPGQIRIRTHTFPSGTYYYSLLLDGEKFDTKPMVILP